jgi:hypothetical protein
MICFILPVVIFRIHSVVPNNNLPHSPNGSAVCKNPHSPAPALFRSHNNRGYNFGTRWHPSGSSYYSTDVSGWQLHLIVLFLRTAMKYRKMQTGHIGYACIVDRSNSKIRCEFMVKIIALYQQFCFLTQFKKKEGFT